VIREIIIRKAVEKVPSRKIILEGIWTWMTIPPLLKKDGVFYFRPVVHKGLNAASY